MQRREQAKAVRAYQERQVADKKAMDEALKDSKVNDLGNARQEHARFEAEMKEKKDNRAMKCRNHALEVLEQQKEPSRTFAKTGIAIIRK